MTTANRIESPRPNPVAAGRTSPPRASDLGRAYAILLTEESLIACALAVFRTATVHDGTERRQQKRAIVTLSELLEPAYNLAGSLDLVDGEGRTSAQLLQDLTAIAEFEEALYDAKAVVRAIDVFGEMEGLGLAALHADMTLTVATEQLARAEALIRKALKAAAKRSAAGAA